MTLKTFFIKFDTFADAPNAVAKMLAPLPGCMMLRTGNPVVSLRSTTGYTLSSLRDMGFRHHAPMFRGAPIPAPGATRNTPNSAVLDAGGIPACSRWLSEERATPPDSKSPFSRTPAGVPARTVHP